MKKNKLFILLTSTIMLCSGLFSCSSDDTEATLSDQKQITEFSINGTKAEIDQSQKTISLILPEGTDITKLTPIIKLSEKATINAEANKETNFTNPVSYTVTAQDGTKQVYTANIRAKQTLHLISKVLAAGTEYMIFGYDANNRLKSYEDKEDHYLCTFEYDTNGVLSKFHITFDNGTPREYIITYKNATTIETSYIEDNIARKDLFELDDKGLLQKYTENVNGDKTWCTFQYDDKGNMLKELDNDGSYTLYTYDNKKGMLKDLPLPKWVTFYTLDEVMITPNNIATVGSYTSDGNLGDGIAKCTYIYNANGYPASYTIDGDTDKITYSVEYKLVEKQ